MASTPDIQLVPLDFDLIRDELKRFLKDRSEFQDYNFEGSALSLLVDVLAYDAYYHGWYTNFAVNEVFLQTAQIRNSVVSAAKQVGYIPRSVTGSRAEVDVTIGGVSAGEGSLLLAKYTKFRSNAAGTLFDFYTMDDTLVYPHANTTITMKGVELREGTLLTQVYDVTQDTWTSSGTTLRVLNQNVDTTTLNVLISPTTDSEITYEYTRATSAATVNSTSNVYFLFETNTGDYEIQFGDGRVGRNLSIGQQVTARYLVSRGATSTGANNFTFLGGGLGTVSNTSNVTIVLSNVNIPAHGGAARESIESIKRLAPNIYQTQGRVVTPDDARAVLLSEVSGIDSLTVWGGEDNIPPKYGKMFICLKPVDAERFGPTQKNTIIKQVLRPKSSPILSFEAVDPDYIYLVTDSEVRYTQAHTALSIQELQTTVRNAIDNYRRTQLGQFGAYFRYSQLSSAIDDAHVSLVSNMTALLLEKRLPIVAGSSSYTVKFSNPLFYPLQLSRLGGTSTGNTIAVSSKVEGQLFSHVDESGLTQKYCWIQNDGADVHVYKTSTNSTPLLVKSDVGTVNFDTGTISFTNFTPKAITTNLISELKIRAIPFNSDIAPTRDQIILLPPENIVITMVNDLLNRQNTTAGRTSGQLGSGSLGV